MLFLYGYIGGLNMENLRVDIVPGTDFKIIQDKKKFSYGIDAILLSSFTRPKGLVMDLGTGTGIIPMRLAARDGFEKIYGVEIQEEVYRLAQRNVELNNLQDRVQIINMNLNELHNVFGKSSFDVIVSNPPYMKSGGAIINPDENFAISRHEIACKFEDIARISNYLLKPLGKFYLVHRPDRLVDILYTMRIYNIEPKYIRFIQPKANKKPNLILIEGLKNGKPDLKFHQPLIVYNEDGSYTEEIYKIYGMDKVK